MKIAHALGWYFPDSVGGTEVYVAGLCRRLRAAGHDVAVVAPDPDGRDVRRYQYDNVPVFRYPIPSHPTREEAQAVVPARGASQLVVWLQDWRPDVFHTHSITTGLGRHEIAEARRVGASTVLTHHLPSLGYVCRRGTLMQWGARPCDGLAAPAKCAACTLHARGLPRGVAQGVGLVPTSVAAVLGRLPGKMGTTLGMSRSILDNQAMQRDLETHCDRMVVLNETARGMLLANGAASEKLVVNRLGHGHLAVPSRPRDRTESPVRFAFFGRFHPTKGVYELARAVRAIPRDVGFSLDIHGVIQSDLERRVRADILRLLGDDPRARVCEAVAPNEVLKALAAYDVLCCPSTWFENGPTVAIESMAVGTPVIGTRLGNLAELVEDGVDGRLVEAGSHAALAEAMIDVTTSPDTVNRWRAGLPPARTMDQVAADYVQLYGELRGREPATRRRVS